MEYKEILDLRIDMLEKLDIVKELHEKWNDIEYCMCRCRDELELGGPFINHDRFATLEKACKKFFALEKKYNSFIDLSKIPHD